MRRQAAGILAFACLWPVMAADDFSTDDLGAEIELPTFEARMGLGFNYDLLRDPFDVSFEYPEGYFGLNLPLEKSVNLRDYTGYLDPAVDSMFDDPNSIFLEKDKFRPTAGARQNPNPTIRVDVPMVGGVATFSSTQNFYMNYSNTLGNPNIFINPDSLVDNMSLMLRGTINVPLSVSASWESMTFGYAFEVNPYVKLALNLHRHVFVLDMRGKVDVDMLGRYDMDLSENSAGGFEIPSITGELDYSSKKIHGDAYGHYEAEVWSPTIACKAWRFSFIGRIGINTRANGSFRAQYKVPFFVDGETFEFRYDMEDVDVVNDPEIRQKLLDNATDSIVYSSRYKVGDEYRESDLIWKMPTGLTVGFDIIPQKLKFSYTKLFGEVGMKLDRIAKEQVSLESGAAASTESDSVVIDFGVSVDNIMLLEVNLFRCFLNLGVFGMDVRYGDEDNILGKEVPSFMKLGRSAMLPILSFGTCLGTRIQLLIEGDVLPLPALKTGVFYYF